MSTFYPAAMNGHHPLTPPYSTPFEPQQCCPPPYYRDGYRQSHRTDSAVDYSTRLSMASSQQPAYQRSAYGNQSLPPISTYYEPMGAPILPPLRTQDAYRASEREYQGLYQQGVNAHAAQQPQAPQKEEQPTGGVSATLDYEMDRMTDFVAEAAQTIVFQQATTVHPSFRKWVSQVLSATRLPSATILLSLHYLSVRMRDMPATVDKTENQLYRLLCVSMILGSKFLDDNTFINRSWSDVSGIKVSELNTLEIKWLALIGFDLHADPDEEKGVSSWIQCWQRYDAKKTAEVRLAALSPLNTDLQRRDKRHSSRSSYQSGYAKTAHGSYTPLSSGSTTSSNGTPYLSADPWNHNDSSASDYYSQSSRFHGLGEHAFGGLNNVTSSSRGNAQLYGFSLPPLHSVAPAYYSPWNHASWDRPHGFGCHCGSCSRHATYMPGTLFAPQTVVG